MAGKKHQETFTVWTDGAPPDPNARFRAGDEKYFIRTDPAGDLRAKSRATIARLAAENVAARTQLAATHTKTELRNEGLASCDRVDELIRLIEEWEQCITDHITEVHTPTT